MITYNAIFYLTKSPRAPVRLKDKRKNHYLMYDEIHGREVLACLPVSSYRFVLDAISHLPTVTVSGANFGAVAFHSLALL